MNLGDFVRLFDTNAVAEGKVAFTFHVPKSGKWNFWSDPIQTAGSNELAKDIMQHKELAEQEISGFEEVSLEPWGEDDGVRVRITFS